MPPLTAWGTHWVAAGNPAPKRWGLGLTEREGVGWGVGMGTRRQRKKCRMESERAPKAANGHLHDGAGADEKPGRGFHSAGTCAAESAVGAVGTVGHSSLAFPVAATEAGVCASAVVSPLSRLVCIFNLIDCGVAESTTGLTRRADKGDSQCRHIPVA